MPSKSTSQARLMAASAHNPQFAAKVGMPMSVAKDFNQADKGGSLLHKAMVERARSAQKKDTKTPFNKG